MADPSRGGSGAAQVSVSTPAHRNGLFTGASRGNAQNPSDAASSSAMPADPIKPPKKKRHRSGKKRRNRRQSFIAPSEATEDTVDGEVHSHLLASRANTTQADFYRLRANGQRSNTSLESEALLDHREHAPASTRPRRETFKSAIKAAMPFGRHAHARSSDFVARVQQPELAPESAVSDDEDRGANDRTPLLSSRARSKPQTSRNNSGFGYGSQRRRRTSVHSRDSSRPHHFLTATPRNNLNEDAYDVNNPPSVPASPTLDPVADVFLTGSHSDRGRERDTIIDIDAEDADYGSPPAEALHRRHTTAGMLERDVCFPGDVSEHGDGEEEGRIESRERASRKKRRRQKAWPDLDVLDEWSREEKEERTHLDLLRAKKISEPVMVGGRLRPAKIPWHREDNSSWRFTYFNEHLDETIHARTISDLQEDMTFVELFRPQPPVLLSESSSDEEEEEASKAENTSERPLTQALSPNDPPMKSAVAPGAPGSVRSPSVLSKAVTESAPGSGRATPKATTEKGVRYGNRPTFWLDVMKPTEAEMAILGRAFGIHQLTLEDIYMDEPREKVELFKSYYFVNYRTFEQDKDSDDYLEPVNFYVVVFRTGVITFHHSQSPHPANVRRRIRQLNEYMIPGPDFISYGIIDDVTDVFSPIVTEMDSEVNNIDEDILYMNTTVADDAAPESQQQKDKKSNNQRPKSSRTKKDSTDKTHSPQSQGDMGAIKADGDRTASESGGDMLRRIGESRKKVMSIIRLLGSKADVIKGFAKRCNERVDGAPQSDIALYLSDIQDHVVTMTGSLGHLESMLSRAHGNYVAQINLRMNDRAEQNADVLGKLTVLGTIVLPMNIITGMWGMNVWVPGQEIEGDLTWFFCITAGLIAFGLICYFIAKKVYRIV